MLFLTIIVALLAVVLPALFINLEVRAAVASTTLTVNLGTGGIRVALFQATLLAHAKAWAKENPRRSRRGDGSRTRAGNARAQILRTERNAARKAASAQIALKYGHAKAVKAAAVRTLIAEGNLVLGFAGIKAAKRIRLANTSGSAPRKSWKHKAVMTRFESSVRSVRTLKAGAMEAAYTATVATRTTKAVDARVAKLAHAKAVRHVARLQKRAAVFCGYAAENADFRQAAEMAVARANRAFMALGVAA